MDQLISEVLTRIAKLEERTERTEFPTTGIVSAERIRRYFHISNQTLARWERLGLKRLQLGTKAVYFLAEDVLELFREKCREEPPPPYKSQVALRAEARKKGLTP